MKIGLVGYGAMGKVLEQCLAETDELVIFAPEVDTPLTDTSEKVDVLIDFSNPRALDAILSYVEKNYRERAFFAHKNAEFALASLGNDAGIYGSAKLILDLEA